MKTQLNNTPTTSRVNVFFSNFKNSKRVSWSSSRNYSF